MMYGDGKFDVVCLSGGGTKAIGHLGVLHYYYEKGQLDLERVKDFPGTSAGSIINLLLIVGYAPMEILGEVYGINNFFAGDDSSPGLSGTIWDLIANYGFLSINSVMKTVETLVIKKLGYIPTLKQLYKLTGKRLICPAVNISKKPSPILVYISPESHPNMRCTDVVKLSSKLPIVFQRIQYNGDYYEDGGLGDNFPIEAVDIRGKNVLGIIVTGSDMGNTFALPFLNYLYRLQMFPINTNTYLRAKNLEENVKLVSMDFDDVPVIELNIEHSRKMKMFMRGYKEAEIEEKKEKLFIPEWSWNITESPIDEWKNLTSSSRTSSCTSSVTPPPNSLEEYKDGWDIDIKSDDWDED